MIAAFSMPDLGAGDWIDLVCAVFLGISVLVGAVRGLSGQVARLLALAAGLSAAVALHPVVRTSFFSGSGRSEPVLALASAIVAGAVAGIAVRALVSRFIRLVVCQPGDSLIGAALSGALGVVFVCVAFSFVKMLPFEGLQKAAFGDSLSGRLAEPVAAKIVGMSFPRGCK